MTLTDLRYLLALARERHFGRAAEKCHVSQPTLSVAIKKVEEELGVQLFERGATEVKITATGQRIVSQAEKVLLEAAQIPEIAAAGKDPLAGPLRLGVIYTIGPYLLPRLIPRVHELAPRMPLIIQENYTTRLAEALKRGDLDVVILSLPFEEAGIVAQPVALLELAEQDLVLRRQARRRRVAGGSESQGQAHRDHRQRFRRSR